MPIHAYSVRYMRSIYGTDDRPPQDLTARARIRDAALQEFAERGFEGATIRGIARAAQVSPGLVQHHFGSKEALRRACDDAVLDLVRRKIRATETGEITNPDFMATLYAMAPPLVRYVARAVVDGSSAGAALVDEIAAGTAQFLSATWPERFPSGSPRTRDAAAVLVAQSAGTIVLHEHVARQMGLRPWRDIVSPRIGLAQLDVYEAIGEFVAAGWGAQIRDVVAAVDRQAVEGEEESE
jgi:TetR/AcrR family transcriptional regulator, regulator of cefoperazone and chloramphenicol sensitivity